MSAVREYLLTVEKDKQEAKHIAESTAKKLETKQLTLIEVVQSLGEYINDEDTSIRAKTIGYLSAVLAALPDKYLSRQQLSVLCQFYCDRVEDGGAVEALTKLQGLGRFDGDMTVATFRALVEHFQDLQLKPQSQRFLVLELLNGLMTGHRQALRNLGDESLIGITDLVSGEKDPRNLMLIFSILKAVMVEWKIEDHVEMLFDSVFCYFPITFRPPPNDPYGITAQDLKIRLRDCIASTKLFAPYAFPQLLDKLDSTSPNVKKDVLQTITACASSYDANTISRYSITLWDSLKYEILTMQEEDLAEEALAALRGIGLRLSTNLTSASAQTSIAQYMRPITKECNEQLHEPQHKQAKPAGRILSCLAAASAVTFTLVVKAAVAPLLTLYQDAEGIATQRALLEVLVQLFESAIEVFGGWTATQAYPSIENPLNPFKDRLFELFSQALMSTAKEEISFRVVASRGLLRLAKLRNYLEESEIGMVVQYYNEIVLTEDRTGRDDLKNEAIQALVEISISKPKLIMDITFPAFMSKLPDTDEGGPEDYIVTLEGLARLSVEKAIFDTLIRRLLNKLDVVLSSNTSPAYPRAILSALLYVFSRRKVGGDLNLQSYYDKIVVRLIRRTVLATTGKYPSTVPNDESVLEVLGRLANLLIRALDEERRRLVAAHIYTLFTDQHEFTPVPFKKGATTDQRRTMVLSTYLMAGVHHHTPLPYGELNTPEIHALLEELTRLAMSEDVSYTRLAILRQIALITNKFLPARDTYLASDILWRPETGLLHVDNLSESSIRVIFWIAKALVLRLVATDKILGQLLQLLNHASYGSVSARGFGLLLAPDEVLTKENGATIRLLAKQKVFNICAASIPPLFRSADTIAKPNYLIALSGLLRYVSSDVLMSEIETLLPLLLQSLDLEDAEVKLATVETLTVIAHENPKAVEGHISSLISRLLKAATDPQGNIPKVRTASLRCLRTFPGKVKDSALLPYRKAVIRGLMTVLDDPKRAVRKEAVDCRSKWLGLDEPDEED